MCWFITIGLNAAGGTAVEELDQQRNGLGVRRSLNSDLAVLFLKSDARFEITHGGCSCDLFWPPQHEEDPERSEGVRRRHRKKGWSEAKIARSLHASQNSKSANIGRNRQVDAERIYRDAITELVRRFGCVRIFAHMYSGSQDEESVTSAGRCRIGLAEFLETGFPPDQLVEIVESSDEFHTHSSTWPLVSIGGIA